MANLAGDVFTNDNSLLKAIAAGQCDVGIANTYDYGRISAKDLTSTSKSNSSGQTKGKDEGGTHVNLSGARCGQARQDPEGARKLLEWLSSAEVQTAYTPWHLNQRPHQQAS